ncbi:hypothetical protein HLB44_18665 [Aquincola sp. S2]|uniref:PEGA domain-containing protein n=1 Tax=Pseudaquabacterium terrae TaxID=2732868 RepID=A0ABX2EK74_9BURK|nr:hypothetical protein [Aquabacterium terrae]NRF69020.1 hypothetical protein [Aquabacterium terrae]
MTHQTALLRRAGLLSAVAALLTGCTTVSYDGPRRPDSEVATLESERTSIATIDGARVPYSGGNFGVFKLLPGTHVIGVNLNDNSAYMSRRYSTAPLQIRFKFEPGRTYVTRPVYRSDQWSPEIVEKAGR